MDPLFNLLLACAVFLLLHIVPSSPLRGAAMKAAMNRATSSEWMLSRTCLPL